MADLGGGRIGPKGPGLMTRAPGYAGAALNALGTLAFGISLMTTIGGFFGSKKVRSPAYKTRDEGIKTGQDFPLPVVYGNNKIPGHIIYREDSASTLNETETLFDMAVGFCEGKISGIRDLQIEGRNIEEFQTSEYTNYLGTPNQVADPKFTAGVFGAPCEADTFVSQDYPAVNYNSGNSQLYLFVANVPSTLVFNSPGGRNMDTLLRFNISDMPANLTIVSAEIRLSQVTVEQKKSLAAYATTGATAESWVENTVTYTTKPGVGAAYSGACEQTIRAKYGFVFLNAAGLTALKTAYSAGTTFSCWIKPASGEALAYSFASKENPSLTGSTLIIHYTGSTPAAFRNTAYSACTVDNRAGLLSSKFPECSALIDGRLIYNWNTTTSAYQTTYSNNPAWILYDLLTNDRYGLGLDSGLFDMDSFKTVAAYCDALIALPTGLTEKRYLCDIILDEQTDGGAALTAILSAFLGYIYFVNSKLYLGCEKSETPGATLTTANFIEGSFGYGKVDLNEVPNIIRALYIDPANDYKKAYVQVESEIDRADRDDKILEVPLYGVHRRSQAERIARLMLWRGLQQQFTCSFRLGIKDCQISVGDVRGITHAVPGWTAMPMRILSVDETDDDEMEVQAVEYVDVIATAETAAPTTPVFAPVSGEGTVTERPAPSAPTWTVEGNNGSWRFKITSQSVGAILYEIYKYYEETEDWNYFNSIKEIRGGQGTGTLQLTADFNPSDLSIRTYGRFKIRTVGNNVNSAFSAEQAAWTIPTGKTKAAPSVPTLAGSPTLTVKAVENGNAFLVTVTITAPVGEENLITAYEITRADDGGTGTWTTYRVITIHALNPLIPGPAKITFYNTDRFLKPGYSYRYKVRAIGRNGVVSAWSSYAALTLAGDTTPPAQPTVSVQAKIHTVELTIVGGTEADFNYFKVEKNEGGAGWTTWKTQSKDVVHAFKPTAAQISAGTTFEFRVTAYDVQGNASTVSATSTATAALKTGPEVLTGMGILGWQFPGTFSATDYRVVAWTAATLTLGSGTTYSIGAGNTGNMAALTYIYFDPAVSTTAFQVTTTAATAVGANKLIICAAKNVSETTKGAEFQAFGGAGGIGKLLTAQNLAAGSVVAGTVAANAVIAGCVAAGVLTGTEVNATANITCGSSNDVVRISGDDSTYRWWIGHAVPASAPLSATKGGMLTATGVTLKTAANGERLIISSLGSTQHLSGYNSAGLETVLLYLWTGNVPRLKLTDATNWTIMESGGFGSFGGSAVAGLQISGTGHGECILYDDTGTLKIQLESEGGGRLKIAGTQVVGVRGAAVANPTGGVVVDAECRTALIALLDRCRITAGHGLITA